eukprot:TRINITY_DN4342_c0_g1_i1.p1 TRINITY_DN4342_c0_g1~~TRINITY_DN4342_c0_g1_i1.p1  ORF type:complete len:241 (-),score=35.73 TRINITY_DN4342_c0_g1_i1:337-1059(-)
MTAKVIVVTGATGFIGQNLVRRLQSIQEDQKDFPIGEIRALGRNTKIGNQLNRDGTVFKQISTDNLDGLREVLTDASWVFHCAGKCDNWGRYDEFYQSNVVGTENIVRCCLEKKVEKLVYIATPSVYTSYVDRVGIKESDPLPPATNYYSSTKQMADGIVQKAHQKGLNVVSLRPRLVFGPGDPTVFPKFIASLKKGLLRRIGDGNNIIDMTYIDNAIDALILAALAPKEISGMWNQGVM